MSHTESGDKMIKVDLIIEEAAKLSTLACETYLM
jgi:hypothetical protein